MKSTLKIITVLLLSSALFMDCFAKNTNGLIFDIGMILLVMYLAMEE
jgi:hypothetical protein